MTLGNHNQEFLTVFGLVVSENNSLESIIGELDKTEFNRGSLIIMNNDLLFRGKKTVNLHTNTLLKTMKKKWRILRTISGT